MSTKKETEINIMFAKERMMEKLSSLEREIAELKQTVQMLSEVSDQERTLEFLQKCGGWQDTRTPEEIIQDIYQSRTATDRGAGTFQ